MKGRVSARLAGAVPVIALLLVLFFFSPWFVKGWPKLPVYGGETGFSGTSAFEYVAALVSRFPERYPGEENARSSALWVAEEFRRIGLETSVEEFESSGARLDVLEGFAAGEVGAFELGRISPRELVTGYRGYNVVGISPGQTGERIIIGAHRDIAGSVEGAEDNASGTAVMMELARVLSARPHRYTYVFVSFDAEEAGLLGSAHYAETHRDDPVLAAICLDMTGYMDANCIWLYDYVTARGCAPLWTLALARNVMQAEGLPTYYFQARAGAFPPVPQGEEMEPPPGAGKEDAGPLKSFFRTLHERISGEWNTDSGSFIERGIPAVGFTAVRFDEKSGRVMPTPIHTPADKLDVISPEVLEASGRFVERYVESLNLVGRDLKGGLASGMFTKVPGGYLGPWQLYSFAFLVSALVFAVPVLRWMSLARAERESFGAYVREERAFLIVCAVLSLVAAGCWQMYRLEGARSIPFFKVLTAWFLTLLVGTVGLAIARCVRGRIVRRRLPASGRSADSYSREEQGSPGTEAAGTKKAVRPFRRLLLDVILAVLFVLEMLTLNFFVAIASVGIPLFFVNMLNATAGWKKTFHVLGLLGWAIVHSVAGLLSLIPYGFSPGAPGLFFTMLFHQAAWVYVVAYSFGPDGPLGAARPIRG